MQPDVITIGSHTYAFTLNLFLTAFSVVLTALVGLFIGVQLFKYKRNVTRRDNEKAQARAEREAHEKEKHQQVITMIMENRKLTATKLDAVCERLEKVDERFDGHEHLIEIDGKLYRSTAKIKVNATSGV